MKILAWHFLYPNNELRDGREAPPDGVLLQQDGNIIPCENGLHASVRAIDALCYRPALVGAPICRVELSGTIIPHSNDKHAASERTILWRLDGEATDRVLYEFARWCALQVIHLWNAPEIVVRWLQSGDESLRAAALDAARYAALAAALDAARYAALAAAGAAAGAAARAAARAAAGDAARAATVNTQNAQLERLINEAHEGSEA